MPSRSGRPGAGGSSAGGVGPGGDPVQQALSEIAPYLSRLPASAAGRSSSETNGLPGSNVSLGPVNFGDVNVSQQASAPVTATVNNPAPAGSFYGYGYGNGQYQRQPQQPQQQQGIGMGFQTPQGGGGGSQRLGDVENAWADWYSDGADEMQAQGLLGQANQYRAMADKLRSQATTGSSLYYGAANPNLRVDNPYMPDDYTPGRQSFYPTGPSSGAVNNGGGWGGGVGDVYGQVLTPGLSGAVDGRSNTTAYNGGNYMPPQTGSPAPYEDSRGAQFYGYPQPASNYDSSYTNSGGSAPSNGYTPYQWQYGQSAPPGSYYVANDGYNYRPDLYNYPPMATPQSGFSE